MFLPCGHHTNITLNREAGFRRRALTPRPTPPTPKDEVEEVGVTAGSGWVNGWWSDRSGPRRSLAAPPRQSWRPVERRPEDRNETVGSPSAGLPTDFPPHPRPCPAEPSKYG